MIRIRLCIDYRDYDRLAAAVRRELKRQKATILVDNIDEHKWRIIEARAR